MPGRQGGLRIRLARHGLRNQPLYHLVVIDRTKARQSLPLEKLGEWDPIPQVSSIQDLHSSSLVFGKPAVRPPKERRLVWNTERIRYWLDHGAEPSETVVRLLEQGGILGANHKFSSHGSRYKLSERLVDTMSDVPLSEIGKQAVWSGKPPKGGEAQAKRSATRA